MSEKLPYLQLLKEVKRRDWACLEPYFEKDQWSELNTSDQQLLADLLIRQAREQLLRSDQEAFKTLKKATTIAPNNAELLYKQAKYLLESAPFFEHTSLLYLALESISSAIQIKPYNSKYFRLKAHIFLELFQVKNEASCFQESLVNYEKAKSLTTQNSSYYYEVLWDEAWAWIRCAEHSGEAYEYFQALSVFKKCADNLNINKHFLHDWGLCSLRLGTLINDMDYLKQAASLLLRAAEIDSTEISCWLLLGATYKNLYLSSMNPNYIEKGNATYRKAAELNPNRIPTWISWGNFYLAAGRITRNSDYLRIAIEKFEESLDLDHYNLKARCCKAKAYALWGALEDNIDYLKEAEKEANMACRQSEDSFEVFHANAYVAYCFGSYYDDRKYYEKSMQYYRRAMKQESRHSFVWYDYGMLYMAIGEHLLDESYIEYAMDCFHKAIRLQGLAVFWQDLAIAELKFAEFTGEEEYYEKAIESFEKSMMLVGNPRDIQTEWLYNYGCALDFLGDVKTEVVYYEKAVEILQRVVSLDPEYLNARFNLAISLVHSGDAKSEINDFAKAIEQFQFIIRKTPDDEQAWLEWGVALLCLSQLIGDLLPQSCPDKILIDAEEKLKTAASLGNIQAYYYLGCRYALEFEVDQAIQFLLLAQKHQGLPPLDEIVNDEWLINLQNQESFKSFLDSLED